MPKFMHSDAAKMNPEYYAEMRRDQRRRYYAQTSGIYPRRRWEAWEDDFVMRSGLSIREMSGVLKRSMKSIGNRRSRLRNQEKQDGGSTDEA